MESSAPPFTKEVSVSIFLSNFSCIGDLSHCPGIFSIGPNGKMPSLFRHGIRSVVEEVI
jgi:hypothetical protein